VDFPEKSSWYLNTIPLVWSASSWRDLVINSSPDDSPGNLPERVICGSENKQAEKIRVEQFPGTESWHLYLIKSIQLNCVPYQKSTWSHCVVIPGTAKPSTLFPLSCTLFAWFFNLKLLPRHISKCAAYPGRTHCSSEFVAMCVHRGPGVFLICF
jgi:hypothetical protein